MGEISIKNLIEIDKKLHDESAVMSEHTISMFFQLMHRRREIANIILNEKDSCSSRDKIEIMNGFKENIIKIFK